MNERLELVGLKNIPKIKFGDSISQIICDSLSENNLELHNGDVLLIAQSIISKSIGRIKDLNHVEPSEGAKKLYDKMRQKAEEQNIPTKSPELIQLILEESKEILRSEHVFIVETSKGFVCANAGIDRSNVEGENKVTLLPEDPDLEARKIREDLESRSNIEIAIIITDSFGRPFRKGSVGVAIGISGISALLDKRGFKDLYGKELQSTIIGHVDNLASASQLIMGESDEGIPVVLVRGYQFQRQKNSKIKEILREKETDLFRVDNKEVVKSILKERRSYKLEFSDKELERNIIKECINLSRWAPNAHNNQQWRYIILEKEKMRNKLILRMNEKLKRDLVRDGKSEDFIKNKIRKTRENFLGAPYLILLCLEKKDLEKYDDKERSKNEFLMGVQSVSASATYLLLAFELYHLAACWYCAPLFAREIVKTTLGLPNSFVPMAFFTVGYPLKTPKKPSRRSLDKIIYNIKDRDKNNNL